MSSPAQKRWVAGKHHPMRSDLPTQFEIETSRLGLETHKEMLQSLPLRIWVNRHRYRRYVPERLLKDLGIVLRDDELYYGCR